MTDPANTAPPGGKRATPDECISALRAMMAFSERFKLRHGEPVTYEGVPIEGYTLLFKAGPKLGFMGHGMDMEQIVFAMAKMLQHQRAAMVPDEFRALVMPLTAALVLEVVTFMEEAVKT